MKQPLVSVIVPVYNVEKYVRECVDSILNQTYKNLEIVLVDDGSTDLSGAICDEYKKYNRVSVIHKTNGGLSDARNAGLDMCNGELIVFFDSDDYISPVFIEVMIEPIISGKCEMTALTGSTPFYDEAPVELEKDISGCSVSIVDSKLALEMMLYQRMATGAPFKVCKKTAYESIRFPVGYLYEDVATTYKLFFASEKVGIVNGRLYAYRERSTSITHQPFNPKKKIALKIHEQLINDRRIVDSKLTRAATSRVFQMIFNVFLQVPNEDKETMRLFWNQLVIDRKAILKDKNQLLKKKNKYGAMVTYLGMNLTHMIGNKLLHH